MENTKDIERLLDALPEIEEGDETLLKIIDDHKFLRSFIVGNQKGLLKLGKGVLKAAIAEPAKHELTIQIPDESENETHTFAVASVERDERLEYKPRVVQGEIFTCVDRDRTLGERVLTIVGIIVFITILISLFVGFWTISRWFVNLFN